MNFHFYFSKSMNFYAFFTSSVKRKNCVVVSFAFIKAHKSRAAKFKKFTKFTQIFIQNTVFCKKFKQK